MYIYIRENKLNRLMRFMCVNLCYAMGTVSMVRRLMVGVTVQIRSASSIVEKLHLKWVTSDQLIDVPPVATVSPGPGQVAVVLFYSVRLSRLFL